MSEKIKSGRDAFTFSLQGLRIIASFTPATAIANDRINAAWDARLNRTDTRTSDNIRDTVGIKGRFWLVKRFLSA